MKKNMKILLIVCLVLGVALMALWGYVQANAGAIADISARVDAYKHAVGILPGQPVPWG